VPVAKEGNFFRLMPAGANNPPENIGFIMMIEGFSAFVKGFTAYHLSVCQQKFFQHRDHRGPQRTTENKSMIYNHIVIQNTL